MLFTHLLTSIFIIAMAWTVLLSWVNVVFRTVSTVVGVDVTRDLTVCAAFAVVATLLLAGFLYAFSTPFIEVVGSRFEQRVSDKFFKKYEAFLEAQEQN